MSTTSDVLREIPFTPSNIETMDSALLNFLRNDLRLSTTTNDGFKPVPILWKTSEAAFQVKNDINLRDTEDHLILPIVLVHRTGIEENPGNRGTMQANTPNIPDFRGGRMVVARRMNQEKTAKHAAARESRNMGPFRYPRPNPKVIYQTISYPMLTYVLGKYSIELISEYQEQINDMLTPMLNIGNTNKYKALKTSDGHLYEMFFGGTYENKVESEMSDAERLFNTTIELEILGYIVGNDKNEEKQKIVVRENIVEIKIPRERVIVGDKNLQSDKSWFRE